VLTLLVGGIPRVLQIGIAAMVGLWSSVILMPTHDATVAAAASFTDLGAWSIAVQELALGAALGVMSAVPLLASIAAGRLVDIADSGRARGPYATFFGVLAAAVFVGIDGHVTVMTAIVESHRNVSSLVGTAPTVLTAIAKLVPAAVKLAVPWLITAAVVQIAVGVGTRVAARSAAYVPAAAAVPAALVMMSASLVATLAIAMAAVVRGTL
jgi:flagellar biosynthesis protein FliR